MFTFTTLTHPKSVTFKGYTAKVEIEMVDQHPGVISRIQLWCEDGALATATYPQTSRPQPYEVTIKTTAENEGLLEALIEAEIVKPPHEERPLRYISVPVCLVINLPV